MGVEITKRWKKMISSTQLIMPQNELEDNFRQGLGSLKPWPAKAKLSAGG